MKHPAASHRDECSQLLLNLLLKILLAFGIWAKYRKDWFWELVWGGHPWASRSHHHCASLYPHSGAEWESSGRSDAARHADGVGKRDRDLAVNCPAFRRGEPNGTASISVCRTTRVQGWSCGWACVLSLVTKPLPSWRGAGLWVENG